MRVRIELLRDRENTLYTIDLHIYHRIGTKQFLPFQVVNMNGGMKTGDRLIRAIHHHNRVIVV